MNPMCSTRWRGGARLAPPLALILLLIAPGVALAADIVIDGQFDDWNGQPNLTDPAGDAPARLDIGAIYWATNGDDPTAYFMIQRAPGPPVQIRRSVFYRLFVDTNNNGSYGEASDRLITVDYTPGTPAQIAVFHGNGGGAIGATSGLGDNGLNLEFGVPFSLLGISANQTIRFYCASYARSRDRTPADRAPDSGDIQWAPVPALGYPLLAVVGVGVMVFVIWQRRLWTGHLQK